MNRRKFQGWGMTIPAIAGVTRLPFGRPVETAGEGWAREGRPAPTKKNPIVYEIVRTSTPIEAGVLSAEAGRLLDQMLKFLTGSYDPPLDILSEMFPPRAFVGIKVDASVRGALVANIAAAMAGRLLDSEVPTDHVIVWDRAPEALAEIEQATTALRGGNSKPFIRTIGKLGGYAGGLAAVTSKITKHVTVTALAAKPDGTMAPFAIESLVDGSLPPGSKGGLTTAGKKLLPKSVFHWADLWRVPLGNDSSGSPVLWDAGTILLSQEIVALSRVAHTILANARRARGLGETPEPPSINEATRLGLGQGDLTQIRWTKLSF